MSKKKFYIIFTCSIVVVLIIFEIIMHYFVGEDMLLKKGAIRTIWLLFPIIIISFTFVRDLIIKRKYEDNDKN